MGKKGQHSPMFSGVPRIRSTCAIVKEDYFHENRLHIL